MSGQAVKRGFLAALLDALYPQNVACALCGRETVLGADHLCDVCRGSLTPAGKLGCPAELNGIVAAYRYSGGARDGIRALKYQNQVRLAPFFADAIALPPDWTIDVAVPVPLHPFKQWLRSYNQSALIAESLSKRYGIPCRCDLLHRTRFTRSQTHLDAPERAANVARAFAASPEARGKNILLVDDVTTTHSTILACAAALRSAGAGHIYAACATAATHAAKGRFTDDETDF